ncbi:hypothetical protein ACFFX0_05875 [Citricoccus parietis]|uniref:Uncharacterized protein n=1 Tax=Citricoccus parietis TaxID=592307 RepID=A0ABV5FVR3_9MICC
MAAHPHRRRHPRPDALRPPRAHPGRHRREDRGQPTPPPPDGRTPGSASVRTQPTGGGRLRNSHAGAAPRCPAGLLPPRPDRFPDRPVPRFAGPIVRIGGGRRRGS